MIYLCFLPNCDIDRIRPVLSLTALIASSNRLEIADNEFEFNQGTMMRVNWMVNNLRHEPMRKPIAVDSDWRTIVGDTRLMALKILGRQQVPVLAQLKQPEGQIIRDLETLKTCCGFSQSSQVSWHPEDRDIFSESIEWFDIGDETTTHHCWDSAVVNTVMRRYLQTQSSKFKFDESWCKEIIDWDTFR